MGTNQISRAALAASAAAQSSFRQQLVERLESRRLLSSGDLEPLFGVGDGLLATDFGNTDTGNAVLVQPDGKIIVAGSWDGGSADFAAARYLPNGTLDSTFGGGSFGATSGKSSLSFFAADFCTSAALQSDGKIVLAGYTNATGTGANDFAIARLNANGSPDTTFSGDGKTTIDFGADDRAQGVVIQPDGKIVVAGSFDGGSSDFAVARLNTDGSPDNTFGAAGKTSFTYNGIDFCTSVALQPDGKIVMAGYTNFNAVGGNDFAVARLTTAGALDNTFDTDGKNTVDFTADDRAAAVALDRTGNIVVAGKWDGGASDFAVARFTTSGALDATFGGGFFGAGSGKTNVFFGANIGSNQDFCTDMTLRPDNTIVLAGYSNTGVAGANDFAVAVLTASGAPDTHFDGDGKKLMNLDGEDKAFAVACDFDGSIIVGGITQDNFGVARLRGALDISFNGNGKRITDFGATDTANGVTIDSRDRIIAVGSWDGGASDFAIARYNSDGTPDTLFGGGFFGFGTGMTNVTFGLPTFGGAEFATDVITDSLGRIIVVGYTNNINGVAAVGGNDFAIARLNANGALDTTFSGDGKLTIDFGQDDRAQAVAIQPDGKIVVAGAVDGGASDFAVARINPDGTLDTTFGGGLFPANSGKADVFFGANTSVSQEFATDVAIQPNGGIVLGGYTNAAHGLASTDFDFAVARLRTNGSLDPTFNGTGKQTLDFNLGLGSNDRAQALLIQPDGKIVAAGTAPDTGGDDFAAARWLSNGTLDATFGGAGLVEYAWGFNEALTDAVLQPDGKILLTGYTDSNGSNDFAVMRINANGTVDTSFSTAHNLVTGLDSGDKVLGEFLPSTNNRSFAAALQSDGHLVVVGITGDNFALERLSPGMIAASAVFEFETIQQVLVQFSSNVFNATASDFTLTNLTTASVIPTPSINLTNLGSQIRLRFPGASNLGIAGMLPDGNYRLTLPAGSVNDSAGNLNVGNFSFDFFFLQGDANRDRTVDTLDFNVLAANFGHNPRTFSQADFNLDSVVDTLDFNILAARFGQSLPPGESSDASLATVSTPAPAPSLRTAPSPFSDQSIRHDELSLPTDPAA